MYSDPATGKIAAGYLNHDGVDSVEDWGCGYGGFAQYLAPTQRYVGVDGSKSGSASVIADLVSYVSDVDGLHLRHVLEHNVEWEPILINALRSFRSRMVLTLFTPFQEETKVIFEMPNFNGTGHCMVDIGFQRDTILSLISPYLAFSIENIPTDTVYDIEHMYFLEKPK